MNLHVCPTCGTLSDERYCSRHTPDRRSPSSRVTGTARFQRQRRAVLAEAAHVCAYCGGPATQVDHIIAVSRGGDHYDRANLTACCSDCNQTKGAKAA